LQLIGVAWNKFRELGNLFPLKRKEGVKGLLSGYFSLLHRNSGKNIKICMPYCRSSTASVNNHTMKRAVIKAACLFLFCQAHFTSVMQINNKTIGPDIPVFKRDSRNWLCVLYPKNPRSPLSGSPIYMLVETYF